METKLSDFIKKITKTAGDELLKYFSKSEYMKVRGSVKDVTTIYDKKIDEMIVNAITKEYPNHNLLTEERGFINNNSNCTWIIDSLDGTVNFASGNPMFAVCIALMADNELKLGTIYAPVLNEFYFAEKGKGAFLNETKITVSDINDLKKSYTYVCEGGDKDRKRTAFLLTKIYPEVTDLRKLGSAGIEAAWVALGRGDAYVTTSIEPWDVAPGVLLVEEAGGQVSDFKGNEWKAKRSDLVFSNNRIHNSILKIIKKF